LSEPFLQKKIAGWGQMAPQECDIYRPEKRRSLKDLLAEAPQSSLLARGLGRSYGDAAVNDRAAVIDMTRLDRMLDFDPATGLLECEAGVSLAQIVEIFLPRGYFLPVSPGTKFVTVGGAIANDIHGKNHHAVGSFGQFVDELNLLLANGETRNCSPTENETLFWATVGGLGLTGIILSAKIRLQPVESAYVSVDYHRSKNLDDALATMADSDQDYQYSVAWVDCLAKGASLGRSVLMRGDHAPVSALKSGQAQAPLQIPRPRAKGVPVNVPQFVLNPLSVGLFNATFYRKHGDAQGVIVDYDSYFYPLDGIHHWNRLYGKAGFAQYQATLPLESGAGLVKLLERLAQSRRASFLAVLKRFGEASPGYLSHPMKGYTLTLDLPNRSGLIPFLHELDRILLDYGGRVYCAKDGATKAESFAEMYPRLDAFKAVKAEVDPQFRLSSSLARRLGIVPL